MVSEDITVIKTKKGIESNSFNMFLPLLSMVIIMILMLFYTGYDPSKENMKFFRNFRKFIWIYIRSLFCNSLNYNCSFILYFQWNIIC